MSIRLMTQVWESAPVEGGPLLVLLALADFADERGMCWPSVKTLARRSRMSRTHVQRILRGLETANLITTKTADQGYGVNRYRIHLTGKGHKMLPPLHDGECCPGATPMLPRTTNEPPEPSDKQTETGIGGSLRLGPQIDAEAAFFSERYRRGKKRD